MPKSGLTGVDFDTPGRRQWMEERAAKQAAKQPKKRPDGTLPGTGANGAPEPLQRQERTAQSLPANAASPSPTSPLPPEQNPLYTMREQTELTPAVHVALVEQLVAGNFIETACAYAYVRVSTYEQWIGQGEIDYNNRVDTPESRLYAAVKNAEARSESRSVLMLKGAESQDWRAASTFLERRYPNKWGLSFKVKNEVRKELDRTLEALQNLMSPEAYEELLNALSKLEEDGQI